MTRSRSNPWLNRFAILTTVATVCLIGIGGLVTSHGAGMAVPDWPTTYGYNMFLFPISKWVGGIFYEHSHRLVASGVGLLTTILMVWLWLKEERRWLRWMGVGAFILVVFQGVLGGLRVTLYKDEIGIFHATLAQLFLVFLSSIAFVTSRTWEKLRNCQVASLSQARSVSIASLLVIVQLVLGASMRHQHAGLAIPDFPLAYGKLWPPTDSASLALINQKRTDVRDFAAVTPFQIRLHMAHRIGAVIVLIAVVAAAIQVRKIEGAPTLVSKLANTWVGLVGVQALLGAITVWSNKAADVATSHVIVGAVTLMTGALLATTLWRMAWVAQGALVKENSAEILPKVSLAG